MTVVAFSSFNPLPRLHSTSPATSSAARCARRILVACDSANAPSSAATSATITEPTQLPLLLRAARGMPVERTPVWLLRQAGRYMRSFRAYSDTMPFRKRSEDASIVRTLSLQPWHQFNTDAVIVFSDILTPLPALGIDFDVVPGKGPVLPNPVRSIVDARHVASRASYFDPTKSLPFVSEALAALRIDVESTDCALLGFVGAPFTLAAYSIQGGTSKHIAETKRLMLGPVGDECDALYTLLDAITDMIIKYSIFQLDAGAHAVQLFESWAHHLSPNQFKHFALPWIKKAVEGIKKERPNSQIFVFINGAGGKLELMKEQLEHCVDVMAFDWSVDMRDARRRLGNDLCLQGNVDPGVLLSGDEESIKDAVKDCLGGAAPGPHILNLGHGVVKETPEEAVRVFIDSARELSARTIQDSFLHSSSLR